MPLFFLLLSCIALAPASVSAATLTFDPQERVVGMNAPFLIGVNLDATDPINTLMFTLRLSPGLELVDVSDGNSIINFWVDQPQYDPVSQSLSFSGIIPGGYKGEEGRLLTLSVRALKEGPALITAAAGESHVFLDTPNTTEDKLRFEPLQLTVEASRDNLPNDIPDSTPPETFIPNIARVENVAQKEQWMLVFATQDKGSGIDHYAVRERGPLFFVGGGRWHEAESPYLLKDQALQSKIYVRAYDKKGNIREVMLMPVHKPIGGYLLFSLIFLTAILSLAVASIRAVRRIWQK